MDAEKGKMGLGDSPTDAHSAATVEIGSVIDPVAEKKYREYIADVFVRSRILQLTSILVPVRKLDYWLLPFLSLMYFFNAIDRVSTHYTRPVAPFSYDLLTVTHAEQPGER